MSKTLLKVITIAATGFAAGILLAPKSGKETRKDIQDKAVEAKKQTKRLIDLEREIDTEALETIKTSAKRAKDEVVDMAKSTRTSASVLAGEAKKLGAEAKARANRVATDAKRTAEQVKKDAKAHLK